VHAYVGSTATLLLLLWLISAGLACVLCFAATSGGVALVGDMAASRAFRWVMDVKFGADSSVWRKLNLTYNSCVCVPQGAFLQVMVGRSLIKR
jgi:hypothetical protein